MAVQLDPVLLEAAMVCKAWPFDEARNLIKRDPPPIGAFQRQLGQSPFHSQRFRRQIKRPQANRRQATNRACPDMGVADGPKQRHPPCHCRRSHPSMIAPILSAVGAENGYN